MYCWRVNCKNRERGEDDKVITGSVGARTLAWLKNLDFILQVMWNHWKLEASVRFARFRRLYSVAQSLELDCLDLTLYHHLTALGLSFPM